MGDVLDGYIDKICLVWVEHRAHRVTWVQVGADSLKKRLLVCVHEEGSGCGVDTTMARLERHCLWELGKTLQHFTVSDYVLVARVSRQGSTARSWALGPGRARVANDDKEHAYAVQGGSGTARRPRGEDAVLRR